MLGDLQIGRSMRQRISAARAVIQLLSLYKGADVIAIWDVAKDLPDMEDSTEAVYIGYELLDACVTHKKLVSLERKFLFEALTKNDSRSAFRHRFRVLEHLSEGGRVLEDLGERFMTFLVRILDDCFEAANTHKRDENAREEVENLSRVFDYILGVLKYNSKAFTEVDIDLLVSHVCDISDKTTRVSDLAKAIQVVDALITYSCLPRMSLQNCVELLCGNYAHIASERENAWRTIDHLLGSHHGPAILTSLTSLLKEGPAGAKFAKTRGACQIMAEILKSNELASPLPSQLPKLVSAVRQSLVHDNRRVEIDVMYLVLELCRDENAITNVLDDKVWLNVEMILKQCAGRLPTHSDRPSSIPLLSDNRSSSTSRSSDKDDIAARGLQALQAVAGRLILLAHDLDANDNRPIMRLLMNLAGHLDNQHAKLLIDYYNQECLNVVQNDQWEVDFRALLNTIFKDYTRPNPVRKAALSALRNAQGTGEALEATGATNAVLELLNSVHSESDVNLVEYLCETAVHAATDTSSEETFLKIVENLEMSLLDCKATPNAGSPPTLASFAQRMAISADNPFETVNTHVARCLVRIFLRTVTTSAWKCRRTYKSLLKIVKSNDSPAEARVVALKLLFRLRADTNHGIFVVSQTECEDIAALLCRTTETIVEPSKLQESPIMRPTRGEDQVARRTSHQPSSNAGMPAPPTRASSGNNRSGQGHGRINRPTPPLWLYPGPGGLPEAPQYYASHLVAAQIVRASDRQGTKGRSFIRIGAWLEALLTILQQNELEWEVYSYVLVHLGAQLTNHALFVDAIPQIQLLRSVICHQLANKSFHEPPTFTNLTRSDAATCLFHILTMLVSYREHFSVNEEDEMVKMFVAGIGLRERTNEICIHAMAVCCHELPGSLSKALEGALSKMSHVITESHLAVHILEFLAGLARLPDLFKNFGEDEFKLVFRICFSFLDDVRGLRGKSGARRTARNNATSSRARAVGGPTLSDDLPQYVYALAYHVMAFWYMSLRIQDRRKHIAWITRNLADTGSSGQIELEEQGEVTIDLMHRIAYSDREETQARNIFTDERDGPRATRSWVVGRTILTIETAGLSGLSQITRRRPTGTIHSVITPNIVNPPPHQQMALVPTSEESSKVDFMPEHIFQEYYSPLDFSSDMSVALPEGDPAIDRALSSFDRISPLDGHKVGILYVGQSQTEESEVLSNVTGSADYASFVERVGMLCELQNATFNTQGLDKGTTAADGKYTLAWRDRLTEVVFHVTTMMPTLANDPNCNYKKSHIGNDYVNIIFNNSGYSWTIDNISSDFNFVNIVITPEARASFVEVRQKYKYADNFREENGMKSESEATHDGSKVDGSSTARDHAPPLYYKVTVLTKPSIPALSPAHTTKIISEDSLPAFVRLLALNASFFASVWAARESAGGTGEPVSSWRSRLREINVLRTRYGEAPEQSPGTPRSATGYDPYRTSLGGGTVGSNDYARISTSSTASGPAVRENTVFRRSSRPNIWGGAGGDAGNRNSSTSLARDTDLERSSSAGSHLT